MVADEAWRERLPSLFAPQRWEWAGRDVTFSTVEPPDHLIQSVHVVGFVRGGDGASDRVVCCRDGRPVWMLPGGTREPGEPIISCLDRELREEAGARMIGPVRHLGAHLGTTDQPRPYRPHLPHPTAAWQWCAADVVLDSRPTNPDDGEEILEVRAVPYDEACELLRTDHAWMPDLIELAYAAHGAQR